MKILLRIAAATALLFVLLHGTDDIAAKRAERRNDAVVRSSATEMLRTIAACNTDLHLPVAEGVRPIAVQPMRTHDRPSQPRPHGAGTAVVPVFKRPTLHLTGGLYSLRAVTARRSDHTPKRLCRWRI